MREGDQFILDTLYTHWSYVGSEGDIGVAKIFGGYKATIERKLSELSSGRAREKWEWMARFFNAKQKDSSDLRSLSPIEPAKYSPFNFKPVIERPPDPFSDWAAPFTAPGKRVQIRIPGPPRKEGESERGS